jgi:hypothetical protein
MTSNTFPRSRIQDKNRDSIKYQLSLQRPILSSTGKLNLSQPQPDMPPLHIVDLHSLGKQLRLKILDVSKTPLLSFQTLPKQPVLEELIANDTQINSYVGLGRHPHLKSLQLFSTPLSTFPKFRLSCCILAGHHLTSINKKPVTPSERTVASEYPLLARYLIEAGWEVEVPMPSVQRFIRLASQFSIKLNGVDSGFTTFEAQKYLRPPPALVPVKVKAVETEIETVEEIPEQNEELIVSICEKLQHVGFHVKPDETNVVHAIERLGAILQEISTVKELSEILRMEINFGTPEEDVLQKDLEEDDYDE